MKKVMLSITALICLAGFSSFALADEMGKMKSEMKGEMGKMNDDIKGEKDKMKGKTGEM